MQVTAYITDNKGKRLSAIVPIKKYQQLLNESDELEDIKAFDKAVSRKLELIPLEDALKELEATRKKVK